MKMFTWLKKENLVPKLLLNFSLFALLTSPNPALFVLQATKAGWGPDNNARRDSILLREYGKVGMLFLPQVSAKCNQLFQRQYTVKDPLDRQDNPALFSLRLVQEEVQQQKHFQ